MKKKVISALFIGVCLNGITGCSDKGYDDDGFPSCGDLELIVPELAGEVKKIRNCRNTMQYDCLHSKMLRAELKTAKVEYYRLVHLSTNQVKTKKECRVGIKMISKNGIDLGESSKFNNWHIYYTKDVDGKIIVSHGGYNF